MAKLVKLFIIFGPVDGNIKVIKKYSNYATNIDESLVSTLCLPRIEIVDKVETPKFQTFLLTKEDGRMLYGSGLIIQDTYPGAAGYASFCYALITETPFINATRSLLQLIWEKKCDDIIVRSVMNIPLPPRKRCFRIVPPMNVKPNIEDIYLYRGMTDLPLLDYPLRELFNFIHIDDFLLAFACLLMEFRTLIISEDNYKLMMVGETLTSLLLPLKWCNVYVPILPPIYSATYLDAPFSYIMGINTQVTDLPENLNHIQCRIYCDESRVICDADSLALPLFLNDIKKDIIRIIAEFQSTHTNKPFTYLDDLKFNRAIRILFIKTIRKHILANYERYIVDVPESSADIRQFDVVSYLSDQPEFMRSFLAKFLDTQLFTSFVDENAKRIQQSWLSIFDMEPEELSEHFSDKALEQAFQTASRIHLMDLRDPDPNCEIKTVPASPMKLRRGLASALTNRFRFGARALNMNSTSIDHGAQAISRPIISSPPIHRNSVATVSLKGHLPLSGSPSPGSQAPGNNNNTTIDNRTTSPKAPIVSSGPVSNGKIVELINEVKDLTKRILIDKMETPDPLATNHLVSSKSQSKSLGRGTLKGGNNTLIGALCDLIERVWSHGAFTNRHDNVACCPLWNHLIAFKRLKYVDSKPSKLEFADGSNLDILSPKSASSQLDTMNFQNTNLFSSFKLFKTKKFDSGNTLAGDLISDLETVSALDDVKTDVGKARAFIRLSLERKKLSEHFKVLLSDVTLLSSLYKPYAFLRCEDEREQFLMYLSTLNVVDLPCFTTTFVSVINIRKAARPTA